MRIILFGATGMVGASVLREALRSSKVEAVLSIGRKACGVVHPKLEEIQLADLFDFGTIEHQLCDYDAAIWAIGISSVGLDEAQYENVTALLTLKWARALIRINPEFAFCYCSAGGAGGLGMWARVRQRVENELQSMPFKHFGAVRPGFIRPGPGIRSRTRGYQILNVVMTPIFPLYPLLINIAPFLFTTSEILGRAMLRVVSGRADRFILESTHINWLGKGA